MADKLYIVVRSDLSPGSQAVQGMHAARQYANDHPEIEREWFTSSNHLAMLATSNEESLIRLVKKAQEKRITHSIFREPDLDNQITAVAFEPGEMGKRLCSNLRLALRTEVVEELV
jgi:peptidyl-tRNA hydrolase